MATGGRKVGSGGQRRRGLEGRGPTPKAEDRVYHKAYKAKQQAAAGGRQSSRSSRPSSHGQGAGADWVVGRNPVLEALQADMPIKAAYVAEGSERDDRLREIFKFAAEHSISLLQTTRNELDRLTGGAVHQGVALHLRSYEYAHPDDLMADALDDERAALVVALGTASPTRTTWGAIIRSAAACSGRTASSSRSGAAPRSPRWPGRRPLARSPGCRSPWPPTSTGR